MNACTVRICQGQVPKRDPDQILFSYSAVRADLPDPAAGAIPHTSYPTHTRNPTSPAPADRTAR